MYRSGQKFGSFPQMSEIGIFCHSTARWLMVGVQMEQRNHQMTRTYFVFILFAALGIPASGQTLPMLHGRGGEWMSWTPMQRTAYVQGLADGYMLGFHEACELADRLF